MATNTLLTPTIISNELLRRFKNNLSFAAGASHEYDEKFDKIGDTYNLRVPVKFSAVKSATLSVQDVTEAKKPLVIDTQAHAGFQFTSKDLTLTIDRFGDRYLDSAAVALANVFDVDGLTLAYQSTPNAVGTPGTVPNALLTYLSAGEAMDRNSCPTDGNRSLVVNPKMQTTIVDALKGLFQSSSEISSQYRKGKMGMAAGFTWSMDQNVRTHTVGPLGGAPAVDGANQTGSVLATKAWTAAAASRLKKGDIFTIAGVYAVNPVSGDTLSDLRQFVVTADFSSLADGSGNVSIYPEINATAPNKTVSALPADGALITVLGAASTLTPQGLAYHRDAFCYAMVPLEVPRGVHFASRSIDRETGLSIRIVSQYDIVNDLFATRADIMYGWAARRPEWSCRIAS